MTKISDEYLPLTMSVSGRKTCRKKFKTMPLIGVEKTKLSRQILQIVRITQTIRIQVNF